MTGMLPRGPGYIYCIVKGVRVGGAFLVLEAKGIPLCKVGFSIYPPERLDEAIKKASTWHPEEFRILFVKHVPNMKDAEDRVHDFFDKTKVIPTYPEGGIEWFLADPERVDHVFQALEGENVQYSTDDMVRPPPMKREIIEIPVVAKVSMTYTEWKEAVSQNNLLSAEMYSEWQTTHSDFPSVEDLLTGCFEGITNYNDLVLGLFGTTRRQR